MEMPDVNASLDGEELVYHDYADISIAISTPTGPGGASGHNVESLNFAEIEYKDLRIYRESRNGNLTLEEMQGGTFTITNGGVFGSCQHAHPQRAAIPSWACMASRNAHGDRWGDQNRPMMYLTFIV